MIAPRLKTASILLFWFGVSAQIIYMIVFLGGAELVPFPTHVAFIPFFTYVIFGHFIHMLVAYLLSQGRKEGFVAGLAISFYEVAAFLVPLHEDFLKPPVSGDFIFNISVRILFVVIIFLLISGRKELTSLQSARWRPWNNPAKSIQASTKKNTHVTIICLILLVLGTLFFINSFDALFTIFDFAVFNIAGFITGLSIIVGIILGIIHHFKPNKFQFMK